MKLGLGPTYRLQLRPDFGFRQAAAVVPYLADLGIELISLSPIAEAVPASPTGREVVDPTRLRHQLGGWAALEILVGEVERVGLGLMVDVVPHHLSTYPGGSVWSDVLRHGRGSRNADLFDIDWDSGMPADVGKVALPVLDRPLNEVLESHALTVVSTSSGPVLRYGAVDLPVASTLRAGETPADVLARQHYRLVSRRDPRACNFRRLLEPEDLIRIRVEDEDVFLRTHTLLAELAGRSWLSAVCIDRVDALLDPPAYLRRLADLLGDMPIVVDKVLAGDEQLAEDWPVEGTTGYEAIDDVSGALVDADGLERLAAAAGREGERSIEVVVRSARRAAVEDRFPGEVTRVARLLGIDESEVRERAVRSNVYRTYPSADDPLEASSEASAQRHFELLTAAVARKAIEDMANNRLVGRLAFCEIGGDPSRPRADGVERLVERAAGRAGDRQTGLVPSTRPNTRRSADARARLIALADMPDSFEAGLVRLSGLVATASMPDGTHVPDRLELRYLAQTLLSIAPLEPEGWAGLERRLAVSLRHSARAAERKTSWYDPFPPYEEALIGTAQQLAADRGALLRRSFGDVVEEVARAGAVVALGQVALRSMLPGVPDCYQGDESFLFSLGGPDINRLAAFRDLEQSLSTLTSQQTGDEPASLRRSWRDGRVKMLVTRQALRARRAVPQAFGPGAGVFSVEATGSKRAHVVVLGRTSVGSVASEAAAAELEERPPGEERAARRESFALAVVTRMPRGLPAERDDLPVGRKAWRDTSLILPDDTPRVLVDALTGRTHALETRDGTGAPLEHGTSGSASSRRHAEASPGTGSGPGRVTRTGPGAGDNDTARTISVGDVLSELPVAILVGRS